MITRDRSALMGGICIEKFDTFAEVCKVAVGDKLQRLEGVTPKVWVRDRFTLIIEDTEGAEGATLYIGKPVRNQEDSDNITPLPIGDTHLAAISTWFKNIKLDPVEVEALLEDYDVI